MTRLHLGCIVEGHGDAASAPLLLWRLQQEFNPSLELQVHPVIRRPRSLLVKPGELERALNLTAKFLPEPRAILVLLDADDDCPATLAPDLARRARAERPDIRSSVVLPKFEFEAWFLAAFESLAGKRHFQSDVRAPDDPEAIRNPKKLLTASLEGSRVYSESIDQPALTRLFDTKLARQRAPSFDKFWREVQRLLCPP